MNDIIVDSEEIEFLEALSKELRTRKFWYFSNVYLCQKTASKTTWIDIRIIKSKVTIIYTVQFLGEKLMLYVRDMSNLNNFVGKHVSYDIQDPNVDFISGIVDTVNNHASEVLKHVEKHEPKVMRRPRS